MKAVLLTSAIVGAVGLVPEAAFGQVTFTEPIWLAIWGLTLMMIASTVRARRRKQRPPESRQPEQAEPITAPGLETVGG